MTIETTCPSPRALSLRLAGVVLAGTLALLSTAQAATFAGVDVPPPLPAHDRGSRTVSGCGG